MDNNKHKILMVHNYYQIPGGEDTVVANETKLLRDHGQEVILYTRDNKEINDMGALRKAGLFVTTIYNIRTAREIKEIIRKEHIDVVHVHNTLNLISPAVYYAAVRCKVPVIQTVHNFRLLCPKALFYRDGHVCEDCVSKGLGCALKGRCYRDSFLQTLTCVIATKLHRFIGIYKKINYICLTDFNRDKLLAINNYKGKKKVIIDPDKVYVKPNFMPVYGVECANDAESNENDSNSVGSDFISSKSGSASENDTVASFGRESSFSIIPASDRKNRFIYAGRLDETKGIMVLLEAWKIYCEQGGMSEQTGSIEELVGDEDLDSSREESAQLVICGSGPLDEACHKYIEDNKLCDVEMIGATAHDKVMELVSCSKATIIPTLLYEGFPMSIVESYSVGTPAIGSDIGNAGNIIREGITGYKYAVGDANALAKIMLEYDNRIERSEHSSTSSSVNSTATRTANRTEDTEIYKDIYTSTYEEYCQKYTSELNYKCFTDIWNLIGV